MAPQKTAGKKEMLIQSDTLKCLITPKTCIYRCIVNCKPLIQEYEDYVKHIKNFINGHV